MTIDIQELKKMADTGCLEDAYFVAAFNPETVLALIGRIENLETTVKFFETLTRDQQDKIDKLEAKPKRSNIPCVAMDGSNPFEQKSQYSHEQERALTTYYAGNGQAYF